MEREIIERVLENKSMLTEEEKKVVMNNSNMIVKIYIISMLDTYKTLKDV